MNLLTFDIEEWFIEKTLWGGRTFRYHQYDETLEKVLNQLDKHNIKATFFCVGRLAVEFPNIVKNIAEKGHEIGCHSNIHTWLNKMTEEELRQDTTEALKALEDASGQKVISYRAPAFSITPRNKWAVNVLADCGIERDASIYPTNRDLGGYNSFPQDTPCIISHEGATLKEFPVCLTSLLGKKIAYSGGGYFRIFPYWLVSRTIRQHDYNIFYFHLNDLIAEKKELKSKKMYENYYKEPGTLKNRLIRYAKNNASIGETWDKLCWLIEENPLISLREANRVINWNTMNIVNL